MLAILVEISSYTEFTLFIKLQNLYHTSTITNKELRNNDIISSVIGM
jgi:hypothetical protein